MMKEESKMMKEESKMMKEESKMMKEELKELEGGKKMKELIGEIENKKILLIEKVFKWSQSLCPVRDVHVKLKGRYYPLIEKETGKLYVIDKVKGAKVPFNKLEQGMKFVICSILAERKEQIEKEVEEGKRKYLEGKLKEVNELLNKF